jgi:hypothetical protein
MPPRKPPQKRKAPPTKTRKAPAKKAPKKNRSRDTAVKDAAQVLLNLASNTGGKKARSFTIDPPVVDISSDASSSTDLEEHALQMLHKRKYFQKHGKVELKFNAVLSQKPMHGSRSEKRLISEVGWSLLEGWKERVVEVYNASAAALKQEASFICYTAVISWPKYKKGEEKQMDIFSEEELAIACNLLTDTAINFGTTSLAITAKFDAVAKEVPVITPILSQLGNSGRNRTNPVGDLQSVGSQVISTPTPTSRQTATTQQLANAPYKLSVEDSNGNVVPRLCLRWPCSNPHCDNFTKTSKGSKKSGFCWQRKKPGGAHSDNPNRHYPINAEIMTAWNREIKKGLSTVDKPSEHIIAELIEAKARKKNAIRVHNPGPSSPKEDLTKQRIDQFMQLALVTAVSKLVGADLPIPAASVMPQISQPPLPGAVQQATAIPSSPVRGQLSRRQLVSKFFNWVIEEFAKEEGCEDEVRKAAEDINRQCFSLEDLKDSSKVTMEYWELLGAPRAMLYRIRDSVSDWKRREKLAMNGLEYSDGEDYEDEFDFSGDQDGEEEE